MAYKQFKTDEDRGQIIVGYQWAPIVSTEMGQLCGLVAACFNCFLLSLRL